MRLLLPLLAGLVLLGCSGSGSDWESARKILADDAVHGHDSIAHCRAFTTIKPDSSATHDHVVAYCREQGVTVP